MGGEPLNGRDLNGWSALDGDLFYLGRPLDGVLDIALLASGEATVAPLFTHRDAAEPFLSAAPEGLELLMLEAGDLRAKEELLRLALDQGAVRVSLDPHPVSLAPRAQLPIHKALWYVLSQKRTTACL